LNLSSPNKWLPYQKVFLFAFAGVFYLFLYTFLHEGGHALVGFLSGGEIAAFNVNFFNLSAPHVSVTGDFTAAQTLFLNVGGVGLPALVWVLFLLVMPRRGNLAIEIIKVVSNMGILSTFLVWVIIPILYLQGARPSDDSTNFLVNSRVNPLAVSAVFLGFIVGGWALFRSRIGGMRQELELIHLPDSEWVSAAVWRTLLMMAGTLLVCGFAAFAINGFKFSAPRTERVAGYFLPPAGYNRVVEIDLAKDKRSQEVIYTFEVKKAGQVGVFLQVNWINTPYLDVRLQGPEQYDRVILHGEGYFAEIDRAQVEELLQPGQYNVVLSNEKSVGTVSVYSWEK
jgi:hypothetical protein